MSQNGHSVALEVGQRHGAAGHRERQRLARAGPPPAPSPDRQSRSVAWKREPVQPPLGGTNPRRAAGRDEEVEHDPPVVGDGGVTSSPSGRAASRRWMQLSAIGPIAPTPGGRTRSPPSPAGSSPSRPVPVGRGSGWSCRRPGPPIRPPAPASGGNPGMLASIGMIRWPASSRTVHSAHRVGVAPLLRGEAGEEVGGAAAVGRRYVGRGSSLSIAADGSDLSAGTRRCGRSRPGAPAASGRRAARSRG